MRHRRPQTLSLAVLCAALSFGACKCDDDSPKRAMERRKGQEATGEGADALRFVKPTGTPLDAELIAATLPDALGDATSEGAPELKASPLANEGQLTSAKRSYSSPAGKVTLEVADTLHAPALRVLLTQSKDKSHTTPTSSWKTVSVLGHPGFVQWSSQRNQAVCTLLVGERMLATVTITPASSPEAVEQLAQKIPFAAIAALVAAKEGATPAAAPAPAQAPATEPVPAAEQAPAAKQP